MAPDSTEKKHVHRRVQMPRALNPVPAGQPQNVPPVWRSPEPLRSSNPMVITSGNLRIEVPLSSDVGTNDNEYYENSGEEDCEAQQVFSHFF